MTDVRREIIPLEHSRRNLWSKVSVLTWGIRCISVSAEERSCLEGVYTVRRSERWEIIQRRRRETQLTMCSLFWLGPVTTEEREEEVAPNHVCVL